MLGGLGAQELPGGTPGVDKRPHRSRVGDGSVTIDPGKRDVEPKKVTYVAVTELRDWRNLEGTVIRARMMAFDRKPGASEDEPLTLVQKDKVRLWVEGRKKASEYPLSKLSKEDQAFIEGLVKAHEAAAAKGSSEEK